MSNNPNTSRIKYYNSFNQDFTESRNQDFRLPEDYSWLGGFARKVGSILLYPLILLIDFVYMKFVAHVRVRNKRVLRGEKGGYYLYANHTLLFGDVVDPFRICWPKRPKIVCSAANLGIAIIGGWLPAAGALPIPNSLRGLKDFSDAIARLIKEKSPIVIYPESHMWPWYTDIRPFATASFHYPVAYNAPVYTATTTFQESRIFKKPKVTIYVDGPLNIDKNLSRKEQQADIAQKVRETMESRAKLSDYSYITYRQKS